MLARGRHSAVQGSILEGGLTSASAIMKRNTVKDNTMSVWFDKFTTLVGRDKVIEMTQTMRLHAEQDMERKIAEQQQQQQQHYDWEKLNTKTDNWF